MVTSPSRAMYLAGGSSVAYCLLLGLSISMDKTFLSQKQISRMNEEASASQLAFLM